MKTKFTSFKTLLILGSFLLVGIFHPLNGQDTGYVHTVTSSNSGPNYTVLDNPRLNGNPNAKVVFSQRYIEGIGQDNPQPTGLWYNGSHWAIYNENNSINIPVGVQFNIFIGDNSNVETHIATTENTIGQITHLTGYVQNDFLFSSNYYNPYHVYNDNMMGTYYYNTSDVRLLYTETINPIPINAAFRVMKGSNSTSSLFSVNSDASNVFGQSLRIDHPELNGNPDAVFIYSHYWGYPGVENRVYLPYVTEAFYSGGFWHIYAYGSSTFPHNVWFDIIVPDNLMGVQDNEPIMTKVSIYPNPVQNMATISCPSTIDEIQIYNVQSKLVYQSFTSGNKIELDLSSLPAGLYLAKVKTEKGWIGHKLIKK